MVLAENGFSDNFYSQTGLGNLPDRVTGEPIEIPRPGSIVWHFGGTEAH